MVIDNQSLAANSLAVDTVLSLIESINKQNLDEARTFLSDDMIFMGVTGSRLGGDAYIADIRHMKLKYDIQKVFAEGDDVCLLYDLTMSGKEIYGCGWYHVRNGKINMLKVVFDPRPIMGNS